MFKHVFEICLDMIYGHDWTCFDNVIEHVQKWSNVCVKPHYVQAWSHMSKQASTMSDDHIDSIIEHVETLV